MGSLAAPKDITLDVNVQVMHILVMSDSAKHSKRSTHRFEGTTINLYQHLRHVKGFGKMGAANVDDDQRRTRLDISRYLLSRYEDFLGDFIEQVVTKDETWVHHFDQESKMQSKQWKHPGSSPPTKFKMVHSAGKVMNSIFLESQRVVMIDYLK